MCDKSATSATKGGGNTYTPPKNPQARAWCYTINNPDKNIYKILCDTFSCSEKYVFQLEAGDNKTKHIQGYVKYKSATRFSTMKKRLPGAHLEAAKGSPKQNYEYCTKEETRLQEPMSKGYPRKLKIINSLYEWQQKIVDQIEQPADDRTINWLWDKEGNIGKTSLAKYICKKYNALYLTGKASDMKYAIIQHFEKDECNKDDLIIIMDFSRSVENYISYQGIEEIKNGIFFSAKYESNMVMFNSPHVICFANFEPDIFKLSKDRWEIKDLGDKSPDS